MSRARISVLVVLAVVVLAVGGVYGYLVFLRDDAPPALDSGDLARALEATSTVPAPAPAGTEPAGTAVATTAAPATAAPATTAAGPAPAPSVAGTWRIGTGSVVGYRVQEVLGGVDTEAAGRTEQVTGQLEIAGSTVTLATFTVDMATVTSDSDRRDNQFRGRIMSVDQFPTSTFTLTEPIELAGVPADGETVTATAVGELTLRGVTRSVSFPLEARLEGGRIGVLGSIPITFSDYEIPEPSNAFATVRPDGLLEFVLVFDRS